MRQNVGGLDRKLRFVFGVAFVAVAVLFAERPAVALVSLLAGAGLLFNAVTGFCGANYLLGVDTCSRPND